MNIKILQIDDITHDVKSFITEKPEGYEFVPGQATEVAINKPGWEDKKRPFTFASLNETPQLEFIIKGYPLKQYPVHGGVTEQIHKLGQGDELIIGEPWGVISYKGPGIFIAGGAGITPFIAIFRQLNWNNKLAGNKLIFSNKRAEDIILKSELERIFNKDDLMFILTQDENVNFKRGRVDKAFLRQNISNFSLPFYVCGPKSMVKDVNSALMELGATPEFLVFEK